MGFFIIIVDVVEKLTDCVNRWKGKTVKHKKVDEWCYLFLESLEKLLKYYEEKVRKREK